MSDRPCPVCGSTAGEDYPTPFPDRLRRCRGCGTRFVDPLPEPAELRSRYEREHAAGKWAGLFEAANPSDPPRRARLLQRLAGGAAGRPLLDVGCGDGAFLDAARSLGWRTLGVEIAVGAARRVVGRHPVVVGTLRALRPGAGLGAVTFWDVLEHLSDPRGAVAEAAALLAPGGVLAASMPNVRGAEALLSGPAWRYQELDAYGHLVHLGPAQLGALMTRAGLEVIHTETQGSVDLRHHAPALPAPLRASMTWLLDRASGVLARAVEPLRRGNTLLVVGRRA